MKPRQIIFTALIIFLFTQGLFSQVLWGIDTEDIPATRSWMKKTDTRGNELFTIDHIGDFDYVTSNQKGFLFYREHYREHLICGSQCFKNLSCRSTIPALK